jgi:hypothetical protein
MNPERRPPAPPNKPPPPPGPPPGVPASSTDAPLPPVGVSVAVHPLFWGLARDRYARARALALLLGPLQVLYFLKLPCDLSPLMAGEAAADCPARTSASTEAYGCCQGPLWG